MFDLNNFSFPQELLRMGIAGAVVHSTGFMDLWVHLVRYFHHPSGGPSVLAKVSVIFC